MSVVDTLHSLLLQPLLLIYDWIAAGFFDATKSVGFTMIGLSIVVNLALLPIYYQMELVNRASKAVRTKMEKEVARMKAHFQGRERYYYIRTVHRQFGYRPLSSIFGAADLFLQVLVFATVYQYIESHPALVGATFMGIADLSRSDGLLFGLNLLPIVMTLTNIGSAVLYEKDPKKRRQSFALSALFLVLLYGSPAGLVLYWTSSNLFSLLRNLVANAIASSEKGELTEQLRALARQE